MLGAGIQYYNYLFISTLFFALFQNSLINTKVYSYCGYFLNFPQNIICK